ncbi:GspH/FimT family pseudopilin [Rugamonas apoptosis]|uniref:Type II secretion system protein H n=1 Tax=Rugamonas apoptosis TaxID=2758570 RepID=A0A7W2FFF7_9BURK|nr:GspH/FimT family pseudopilin [Rugamonas apoptosis]MBA5690698.1 GspH/FimT family pseudopilin [Rugamonas apoptosis]
MYRTAHRRAPVPVSGRGFTLPEVLVSLTIIAILAAIAAPSFNRIIATQRSKSIAADLITVLTRTRSEAIKRNTDVTLQPVSDGQWQFGWAVLNPAAGGAKLESHDAIVNATVLGPSSIVFHANGRLRGNTAPSFDISALGSTDHRCVLVDLSGRPYQQTGAC